MNTKKMIKLLSVLLLIAIILTGCDKTPAETDVTVETTAPEATKEVLVNKEEPHESVEAKLENFLVPSEKEEIVNLENVTRLEGTIISENDDSSVLVFRTADVDILGKVTETFTVYNANLKKAVLTVSNSYPLGYYEEYNWEMIDIDDEDAKYPENIMNVQIETLDGGICVINVINTAVTKIDEEIREKNEDGHAFGVDTTFTYYDVAGKKLATTDNNDVEASFGDLENSYDFGSTSVLFDPESGEAVRIYNKDTDIRIANFDYENDKYGYIFSDYGYQNVYRYIEVYSKATGDCILRHYLEKNTIVSSDADEGIFVLEDGDILIRTISLLPEDTNIKADIEITNIRGGDELFTAKVKFGQFLLDVETGNIKELELDYFIDTLIANSALDSVEIYGMEYTEHVVNLAAVVYVEDCKIAKTAIVVLDNDLSVMYETDIIIPEHDILDDSYYSFGIALLENGDYLVSLRGTVADYAIVTKDGKVRTYLPEDAWITGSYIVTDEGVFNFDLECIYDFEDAEYTFECVISDNNTVIVSAMDEMFDEDGNSYYELHYYALTVSDDGVTSTLVFEDEEIYDFGVGYIITYGEKFVLYNANLEHVLTTEDYMTVLEFDGNYYVRTNLAGYDLLYVID